MDIIITRSVWLSLVLVLSATMGAAGEDNARLTDRFLRESGSWSGDFTNYLPLEGGTVQQGRIRLKINVDPEGVIKQSIALMTPDGTPGDYEGYSSLKAEGETS